MKMLNRCLPLLVVAGLSLFLDGCILQSLLSRVTVTSIGEGVDLTIATVQAGATLAVCTDLSAISPDSLVRCNYIVEGRIITSSVTLLSELGVFGLLIDPVILQVPATATGFVGTFAGPAGGNLAFTEVAGSLPADLNRQIVPEPGNKLVIVDFPNPPPPIAGQTYDFELTFQIPGGVTPVPMKMLFAGRVDSGGQTFYPPLLPCETDFANIPQLFLQQSAAFQAVDLTPMAAVAGCNNVAYQLAAPAAAAIPVGTPLAMALLAALLAGCGVLVLSKRMA